MTIIDTARLRLRPWRAADAPDLYELAKDPRIGEVRGKGAMMALELVDPDSQKPDAALTAAVAQAARSRGLILLTCGTYGNVIRLLPPVTMPDELFAEGMEILEQALRDQP